jgi:uncharacterized protein with FMN-binding domain
MKIKAKKIKAAIKILAIISLVVAYFSGMFIENNQQMSNLDVGFPNLILENVDGGANLVKAFDKATGDLQGYIRISSGMGWGGPFTIATFVSDDQKIRKIHVLDHKETPSFFDFIVEKGFYEQFIEKAVDAPLIIDEDVDAISTATVSSVGFTKTIRKSAHKIGREQFGLTISEIPAAWKVGNNEFMLIIFYAIAIIATFLKNKKFRYITMAIGLIFIGFWINRPISISNISAILLGFLPSIMEQLLWYILVPGTLLVTLLLGKNVYCYWMCPFGAMQEFVTLIGGIKLKVSKNVIAFFKHGVYLLLWLALMITFLTNNPALGAFEPFAVLFSLTGLGVQWYLVSVAIIGSFLIPRFWCRFFCPVGAVLQYVAKIRRKVTKKFRNRPGSNSNQEAAK